MRILRVLATPLLLAALILPDLAAAERRSSLRPSTYPFSTGQADAAASRYPIDRDKRGNIIETMLGSRSEGAPPAASKLEPPPVVAPPPAAADDELAGLASPEGVASLEPIDSIELGKSSPSAAKRQAAVPAPPAPQTVAVQSGHTDWSLERFSDPRNYLPVIDVDTRQRPIRPVPAASANPALPAQAAQDSGTVRHSREGGNPEVRHSREGGIPEVRHSHEGGNPEVRHSREGGNPEASDVVPSLVPSTTGIAEAAPGMARSDTAHSSPFFASDGIGSPTSRPRPDRWRGGYHIVSEGETLQAIAGRYGVSEADIHNYNPLQRSGLLKAGQKLYVPPSGPRMAFSADGPRPKLQPSRESGNPEIASVAHGPAPVSAGVTSMAPQQSPPQAVKQASNPAAGDEARGGKPSASSSAGANDGDGPIDKIKNVFSGLFAGIRKLTRDRDDDEKTKREKEAKDRARRHVQAASAADSPPSRTESDLRRPARAGRPVVSSRGFAWPLDGTITSAFGVRKGVPHAGLDIAGEMGAPIRAAASGRVIFSDEMRGYGNVVILDHENGYFSVYAHNSRNLVKTGTDLAPVRVEVGDTIALVGDTGNASGPHVHFEVRRQNKAIDPRPLLPAAPAVHARSQAGDDDGEA